jgi:hypothetical protein
MDPARKLPEAVNVRQLARTLILGSLSFFSSCAYNVNRDAIAGWYQNRADPGETIIVASDGSYVHQYFWSGRMHWDQGLWHLEGDGNITFTNFAVCWKSCDLHEDVHPTISQTWFGIFIYGDSDIPEGIYKKES